jgi:hypothetical protein
MATATPLTLSADPPEPCLAERLEAIGRVLGDTRPVEVPVAIPIDPNTLSQEDRARFEEGLAELRAGRKVSLDEAVSDLEEAAHRWVECGTCHADEDAFETCATCEGSGGFCKVCGKPWGGCVDANACVGR